MDLQSQKRALLAAGDVRLIGLNHGVYGDMQMMARGYSAHAAASGPQTVATSTSCSRGWSMPVARDGAGRLPDADTSSKQEQEALTPEHIDSRR